VTEAPLVSTWHLSRPNQNNFGKSARRLEEFKIRIVMESYRAKHGLNNMKRVESLWRIILLLL